MHLKQWELELLCLHVTFQNKRVMNKLVLWTTHCCLVRMRSNGLNIKQWIKWNYKTKLSCISLGRDDI